MSNLEELELILHSLEGERARVKSEITEYQIWGGNQPTEWVTLLSKLDELVEKYRGIIMEGSK